MKLSELMATLEKGFKAINEKTEQDNGFTITSNDLKIIEKELFQCDEFKNVVRINYIDLPSYLVDEETGEPISTNREFLGGKTKAHQVSTFNIFPIQELKFNKIVDLYSIRLNKRYLKNQDVSKPGIWIYPTAYDQTTFVPINQIRVIWDPNQLNEVLTMVGNSETPKARLLRMFESALDNMEPNVPCEYVLSIRCSNRSIVSTVEQPVSEINIPVEFPYASNGTGSQLDTGVRTTTIE